MERGRSRKVRPARDPPRKMRRATKLFAKDRRLCLKQLKFLLLFEIGDFHENCLRNRTLLGKNALNILKLFVKMVLAHGVIGSNAAGEDVSRDALAALSEIMQPKPISKLYRRGIFCAIRNRTSSSSQQHNGGE